jgi:Glutathione S-transferase, N-terminal domain
MRFEHLARGHGMPVDRDTIDGKGERTQSLTLFVCHGDDSGPRFHPCRRVQEALRAEGIEYEKVIAGHGSPLPFLRKKGQREALFNATGARKLPTLKLADGTVISHSRKILKWVHDQPQTQKR